MKKAAKIRLGILEYNRSLPKMTERKITLMNPAIEDSYLVGVNELPTSGDNSRDQILVGVESESTSSSLNSDCLGEIFSYLSITDLYAATNVCRRWSCVCKETIWNRQKILDFGEILSTFSHLSSIIKLCSGVTKIIIQTHKLNGERLYMSNESIVDAIADSCPRLEQLTVHHSCGGQCQYFSNFTKQLHNLKSFKVTGYDCIGPFLEKLFQYAPKLEEVTVDGMFRTSPRGITSRWLTSVAMPLKSLRFCHWFMDESTTENLLEYAIKHGDRLMRLEIDGITGHQVAMSHNLRRIVSQTPYLSHLALNLRCVDEYIENRESIGISRLKNLTHMEFGGGLAQLAENELEEMTKSCLELSYLVTWGVKSLRVVHSIVKFDRLVSLDLTRASLQVISELLSITSFLVRLKELNLLLTTIGDEACIKILKTCSVLERLDISYNRAVTNTTFDCACDVIRKSPSRPRLIIRIYGCLEITKNHVGLDCMNRIDFSRKKTTGGPW